MHTADLATALAEALAAGQQHPTHARGQRGTLHPIAPMEWEMLARALAAGGFDSPMPMIDALPPEPAPPSARRLPDGALEISFDERAGRAI